jgi:hypothetical protein
MSGHAPTDRSYTMIRLGIRTPSIKTLTTRLKDVDKSKAVLLRRIIKSDREGLLEIEVELDDEHKSIHAFRYNRINHNTFDLRCELLDRVLGTFGIEYIFEGSEGTRSDPESVHNQPECTYLNAGDTYAPTLLFHNGHWKVGCMGDIAERMQ